MTSIDWAGWALFGLVATALLTGVMIGAQLLGLTRLDLPLMLGTIGTDDPDRARVRTRVRAARQRDLVARRAARPAARRGRADDPGAAASWSAPAHGVGAR